MVFIALAFRFSGDQSRYHGLRLRFNNTLKPISTAGLLLWALCIVAALWALAGTESPDLKSLRRVLGNIGVKYVVLWFAYRSFWWRFAANRKLSDTFTFSYAVAACIHFLYCVAQRKFGFDWVHGFDGHLGEGRFAYGVYRISGFVGHPLTLGYCQALALVAGAALYRGLILSGKNLPGRWSLPAPR